MKLAEITPGIILTCVEPTQVVTVVATVPFGADTIQLIYRTPDGMIKRLLLNRTDEAAVEMATLELVEPMFLPQSSMPWHTSPLLHSPG